jgi:hypothetical protein
MTTTVDPLLMAMLGAAVEDPADPLPQMALADYLTEQGPGPVRRDVMPGWLRLAWVKARKGDPRGPRDSWRRLTEGWSVLMDVHSWLRVQGEKAGYYWGLDHHGITTVGGLECFVSEPYGTLETARQQARLLAAKAGCVGVGLAEGHWARGTVRVLLLPMPDEARAT